MVCKICNTKCHSLKLHIIDNHLDLYEGKTVEEIGKLYYDTYVSNEIHICPICGKLSKFTYKRFPGTYNLCCESLSCIRKYLFNVAKEKWELENPGHSYSEFLYEKGKRSSEIIKKNLLEKYGPDITNVSLLQSTKDKVKQTNIEKYGTWYGCTEQYKNQVKLNALEKYGVDSVNKTEEKINKYKCTCIEKYGADNYFGSVDNQLHIKEIVKEKYGVDNVILLKTVLDKITITKRKNNSFNKSRLEEITYNFLCNRFGVKNVIRQYKDLRYINPLNKHKFNCDFYIKTLDLFIEVQGCNTHGEHPYYIEETLNSKSIELIKKDKRMKGSVDIFAFKDILKRSVAKYNKLNYIEIFYKRKKDYTDDSLSYILDSHSNREINVFVEPYKEKINDSLIFYYDIKHQETIKSLM